MTCILAYVLQKLPSRQVRRSKTNRHRRTFFFFFQRQQLQHPPVVEERGKCALEMRSIRFDSGNDTFHPIESNRQSPTSPKSAAQHKSSPPKSRSASAPAAKCIAHIVTANVAKGIIASASVVSKRIATAVVTEDIASPISPTSPSASPTSAPSSTQI